MRIASSAIVLNRSVEDNLKDNRGLHLSLSSKLKVPWLSGLFMADLLLIDAFSFSNIY